MTDFLFCVPTESRSPARVASNLVRLQFQFHSETVKKEYSCRLCGQCFPGKDHSNAIMQAHLLVCTKLPPDKKTFWAAENDGTR